MRISGIILLVMLFGCKSTPMDEQYYNKANTSFREGDYRKAIRLYSDALERDDAFVSAYFNRGLSYINMNDMDGALSDFSNVIILDPENAQAYLQRAYVLYRKNAIRQALNDLNRLEQMGFDNPDARFVRALVYTETQDNKEQAILLFKNLIKEEGETAELLTNLGNVFWHLQQYDSANRYLSKSLKLDDGISQTWNTLGLIEQDRGNFAEAIGYYRRAGKIAPNDPYVLNNTGFAYLSAGKLDSARYFFDQSLLVDRKNPYLYRNLTAYYLAAGDVEAAGRSLERAKSLAEDINGMPYFEALYNLANGRKEEACRFFENYSGRFKVPDKLNCP